jgi:hypothetical protein
MPKTDLRFETKLAQAAEMISDVSDVFGDTSVVAITDSWFGNNSLYHPLRQKLGTRFHLLSRLRTNNNLFDMLADRVVNGPRRQHAHGASGWMVAGP